jgi:hypothetical protein
MMNTPLSIGRLVTFFFLVAGIVVVTSVYVYFVVTETPTTGPVRVVDEGRRPAVADVRREAHLAFRNMTPGPDYGRLAFAPLARREDRLVTSLPCNRLHFSMATGFCLTIARNPAGFRGYLLDERLGIRQTLDLPGMPSRTRVAPDGRLAAYTVFVAGDSYLAEGLSTRTRIVDIASSEVVGDLETFTVTRDGQPVQAVDFNFWGVTFGRDANRFYATLGTGGRILLVEGDAAARTMRVIAEDIECPSLSPDGRHLAFKKKFGAGLDAWWQPAVLNLETMELRQLSKSQHMDDQIEWLDEGHILYAVSHSISAAQRRADVWTLAIDGGSPPSLFLPDAESPAVIRP